MCGGVTVPTFYILIRISKLAWISRIYSMQNKVMHFGDRTYQESVCELFYSISV